MCKPLELAHLLRNERRVADLEPVRAHDHDRTPREPGVTEALQEGSQRRADARAAVPVGDGRGRPAERLVRTPGVESGREPRQARPECEDLEPAICAERGTRAAA